MSARANSKGRSKTVASGKASAREPAEPARDAADGGENDTIAGLQAELKKARARIAELEQRHAEILNRIDWVIDSLQNLPPEDR